MRLRERIELLENLGKYMTGEDEAWKAAKEKAAAINKWFVPEFIELAINNLAETFLRKEQLEMVAAHYALPEENPFPKTVGVVMAGNIPLVGFHDFLAVFLSGNRIAMKPSSKDEVLIGFLVQQLVSWNEEINEWVEIRSMLKGCDAYIATGSNNTSRYFEYYFRKYPHIIRTNRTSVAILDGTETADELMLLADDIFQYFGLGCRNVTKIYVPENYDFIKLIKALGKYDYLNEYQKLKNNYDYNLAILLLNHQYYMSTPSILLVEAKSLFSPIAQLHYEYYQDEKEIRKSLQATGDVQCIVGKHDLPFGKAQQPGIFDYADGVDTLHFLKGLTN